MGWRRLGLLAIAGWLFAIGFTFDRIADAAGLDALLPELGSPLLYLSALLVVALFVRPTSKTAYRLGGAFGVGGLVARPLIVWMNFAAGFTRSGWSVVAAVLVYGALALGGVRLWIFHVGPWLGRRRAGVTVPGD